MNYELIKIEKEKGNKVQIIKGLYRSKLAFITLFDDKFVKVTPTPGDLLVSIRLRHCDITDAVNE